MLYTPYTYRVVFSLGGYVGQPYYPYYPYFLPYSLQKPLLLVVRSGAFLDFAAVEDSTLPTA